MVKVVAVGIGVATPLLGLCPCTHVCDKFCVADSIAVRATQGPFRISRRCAFGRRYTVDDGFVDKPTQPRDPEDAGGDGVAGCRAKPLSPQSERSVESVRNGGRETHQRSVDEPREADKRDRDCDS